MYIDRYKYTYIHYIYTYTHTCIIYIQISFVHYIYTPYICFTCMYSHVHYACTLMHIYLYRHFIWILLFL